MLNKIGKWKLTVLETGTFRLDGGAMMGSVPKVLWEKTNPPDTLNRIELAMRCLVLDDGVSKVLIETGIGDKHPESFYNMFDVKHKNNISSNTLSNNEYSLNNITDIIITHLHFDHAGGATKTGDNDENIPTFLDATYHISKENWDAAVKPNPRDKASYLSENFIPIQDYGILNLVDSNAEILPGVSGIRVDGHTPGQQLVKVESDGDILVFCGDLIPLKSHLKLPWIMGYDLHALQTLKEKTRFLNQAAKEGWWLFFYHDPETVAVKITKGKKYFNIIEEVRRSDYV
jgi:glyoxylase-like metal-dependent hydrolase (beta-lactamase superfamily II)